VAAHEGPDLVVCYANDEFNGVELAVEFPAVRFVLLFEEEVLEEVQNSVSPNVVRGESMLGRSFRDFEHALAGGLSERIVAVLSSAEPAHGSPAIAEETVAFATRHRFTDERTPNVPIALPLTRQKQSADKIHAAMDEIQAINEDLETHGVDILVEDDLAQGANGLWSAARTRFSTPQLRNGREKPMCNIRVRRSEDILAYLRRVINKTEIRPDSRPMVVNISRETLTALSESDILTLSEFGVKILPYRLPRPGRRNTVVINPAAIIAIDLCAARINDYQSLTRYSRHITNAYKALTSTDLPLDTLLLIYEDPAAFVKTFTLTFPEIQRHKLRELQQHYKEYLEDRRRRVEA